MAMTMVVKLLAAGREVVTAYYFGTGRAVDAFLVNYDSNIGRHFKSILEQIDQCSYLYNWVYSLLLI